MRYRGILTLASTGVFAALVQASGCGADSAGEAGDDGGTGHVDATYAPRDATPSEPWDAGPTPGSGSLEGWVLHEDYDPNCGFYYPSEKKYLPPPVAWEPCSVVTDAASFTDAGPSGPPGMVCQRMATPWKASDFSGQHLDIGRVVMEGGTPLLLVNRITGPGAYQLVAEADGLVRTAMYSSGHCRTSSEDDLAAGNFMRRVYSENSTTTRDLAGGAIGGSIDALKPRVYFPKDHQPSNLYAHQYSVGRSLFIEAAVPDRIYTLATGELVDTIALTPEDQDLYYFRYRFHEDTLFWMAATARRSAIKVWTRETGIRTLQDHGSDLTRGLENFATDGTDMVWIEGRGRTNVNSLIFDKYETWTAKYSIDKATVDATKRRLRSEDGGAYGFPYAVGCGYAAVHTFPTPHSSWGQSGFRLIRLSDGVSWFIVDGSREQQRELHFEDPLGISCDHVYVRSSSPMTWSDNARHFEVVRIRIDSLGEGTPPD